MRLPRTASGGARPAHIGRSQPFDSGGSALFSRHAWLREAGRATGEDALRTALLRSAAAILICAPGTALAQVPAPAGADAPGSRPAGIAAPRLDEIIVTAQRRSERLQDVPIAVTSMSAAAIAQQGITSTAELAQAVPSLSFTKTVNTASLYIRGVGSRLIDPTSESPVAIYVDDVYMAAPQANVFTLMGIKQIDVLNGPQGTLFGRNATGGVIQIQTLDPVQSPHLDASVTYGNYDYLSASAYASTGLGDNVATSLSALYENQGRGFGRNLFDGSYVNQLARHNISLRNKWLFTLPTNTEIRLSADYARLANTSAFQRIPGSVATAAGAVPPTSYPGAFNTNTDEDYYSRTRTGGVSLKIDQDFGPLALTSITAYRASRSFAALDQDTSTAPASDLTLFEKFHNYSQELRFKNQHSSIFNWVFGGYFYKSKGGYDPFLANGKVAIAFDQQETQSLAAFAQGTLALRSDTNLTGGVRYSTEDQMLRYPAKGLVQKQSIERPTFRIALDHHFSRDVLGYVSYNTGFKSGGYNLLRPGNAFQPEKLKAVEVGLKTEWFDHTLRFNVDGFLYRYTNQQVNISTPGGSILANAAGSRIKGLEASLDYVPTSRLRFSGGLAWVEGHYTDYPNYQEYTLSGVALGAPVNAKGKTTQQTPRFVGNLSARYELPTTAGKFVSTIGVQYNSGFFWDPANLVPQKAYTIVNGSVTWSPRDGPVDIQVWVKNLLDERYFNNASIGAAPVGGNQRQEAPRTFGATVAFHYR